MNLVDILSAFGNVVDLPGSSLRDALAMRNPLDQWADPFGNQSEENRTSGRGLLEHYGVLGENQAGLDWGDAAGFGVEMLADPLNLIPGVGAMKAARAGKLASSANELSMAQRAMGFMPEEIAQQTKLLDEATGLPQRMYHGTPYAFDKYDANALSDDSLFGPGVYLTANPNIASDYTSKMAGRHVSDADVLNYYKPGSIVNSYGGQQDEVLDVFTGPDGSFSHVKVRAVSPGSDSMPRMHFTRPDASEAFRDQVSPNVRMHYVDSRNPFNADVDRLSGSQMSADDAARLRESQIDWIDDDPAYGIAIDRGNAKFGFDDLTQAGFDAQEVNQMIRSAGFDSIRHMGGGRIGKTRHDVAIAFDPSQVYAPYIAPAIQEVPSPAPWLKAGAGYNVLAQLLRSFDGGQ